MKLIYGNLKVCIIICLSLILTIVHTGVVIAKSNFGTSTDGPLTIAVNTTDNPIDSACNGLAGTNSLTASNPNFLPGQTILIHQTQGTNAGTWMINQIYGYSGNSITLTQQLNATYNPGAQVLVMKQYNDVTVYSGATWVPKPWNGVTGGILAFYSSGILINNGTISADGYGFRGGTVPYNLPDNKRGTTGEGTVGPQIPENVGPNGNGGGGGDWDTSTVAVSAGGSNGTAAADGTHSQPNNRSGGFGGLIVGSPNLSLADFGGGGASGANNEDHGNDRWHGGTGGNGGGFIVIIAANIINNGYISTNGYNGGDRYPSNIGINGGGGGGAGGSIFIRGQSVTLGANLVNAIGGGGGAGMGGSGGQPGTSGGNGRVHIEYCTSFSGSTNPQPDIQQLNCFPLAFTKSAPANRAIDHFSNPLLGSLNWNASSGTDSYEYCLSTTSGTCSNSWISAGSNTSIALSGLNPGATYYWQVRTRNSAGTTEADGGAWWSFTKVPDWDVNGDRVCDSGDVAVIGLPQNWLQTGVAGWNAADVNRDGVIDSGDVAVIGLPGNWLSSW